MNWEDVLLHANVELIQVRPHNPATHTQAVVLGTPHGPLTVEAKRYRRAPSPSELRSLIAHHHDATKLLLIIDAVNDNLRTVLFEHRVSYVTTEELALFLDDGTVIHEDLTPARDSPPRDAADVPWRGRSAFQVLRRLIENPPGQPQTVLARDAHVSQPRVSQVLKTLHELGFAAGANQNDRTGLLDLWLAHYPGPGGVSTRWYGRDPVDQVASAAYEHAVAADAAPLLSGESAADLIAPYARPTSAVLYVEAHIDLSAIGLVRTPDPEIATLELVVPEDPTVRPQADRPPTTATLSGQKVELADPLQILWDVARSTGIDAPQQVEHLRLHLLDEGAQGLELA
jgi:hypothetical protein